MATGTSALTDLQRTERRRRWGLFFVLLWMVYLVVPLEAGWRERDTWHGRSGLAALLVFSAVYAAVFLLRRIGFGSAMGEPGTHFSTTTRAVVLTAESLLVVIVCLSLGQVGTATTVYLVVLGVLLLSNLGAWIFALAVAGATLGSSVLVSDWKPAWDTAFSILAATLAVWGVRQALRGQAELLATRDENARLMLLDQRHRFARDLHDLLGHSLTVVTLKAQLAGRLIDADPERARAELADLERLARDALTDVRTVVDDYRALTLPGELARARQALAAAEIEADLPNSTDEVPTELRELFAWAVREGVTNVVRHSGARRCAVVLSPRSVEVRDDGAGAGASLAGHGLTGLSERAAAAGARVVTASLDPGYSVRVVAG